MSLLDLLVILVVIVLSVLIPFPGGTLLWVVGALIAERVLKGEKL